MTLATVDRYDPAALGTIGGRAIVIGGSMAGLSAAGVLADGFEEVVVVERDPLPDDPVSRDGAPQTSHPHALLEAGRATFEDIFPGFSEAVLSKGGILIDSGTDMDHYDQGGFLSDTTERFPTYCATRALFEHVVREQVAETSTVRFRDGAQVTGLELDDTGTVTGVSVRANDGEERLAADLVVDATGRTSRTPTWLEAHDFEAPAVDEVQVDVTYSTIRIERPPTDRRVLFVPPSAPRTRGAALIPVEDDRWEVIVQGVHGDDAPTDPGRLLEFIDTLPVAELGTLVRQQSWTSDGIDHYPYPASRRHRYEDLDRFPDGLVVLGDAIASFNPIYGQGMSVAALEAVELQHTLASDGLTDVGPRFFERAARVVDTAWQMAIGADFQFPQTTGPKPTGVGLSNAYTTRLLSQAQTDPVLSAAFLRAMRLEVPPSTLFAPRVVWRVLRPSAGTVTPLPSLRGFPSR